MSTTTNTDVMRIFNLSTILEKMRKLNGCTDGYEYGRDLDRCIERFNDNKMVNEMLVQYFDSLTENDTASESFAGEIIEVLADQNMITIDVVLSIYNYLKRFESNDYRYFQEYKYFYNRINSWFYSNYYNYDRFDSDEHTGPNNEQLVICKTLWEMLNMDNYIENHCKEHNEGHAKDYQNIKNYNTNNDDTTVTFCDYIGNVEISYWERDDITDTEKFNAFMSGKFKDSPVLHELEEYLKEVITNL